MIEFSKKKLLADYGLFCAFIAIIFVALIGVALPAHKRWISGLRNQIGEVIEQNMPHMYTVGEYVPISNPFSVSSACYMLKNLDNVMTDSADQKYGIILRIMTIYGYMPAIYIYSERYGTQFVGFAGIHNNISEQITTISVNSSIAYWAKRIPDILKTRDRE